MILLTFVIGAICLTLGIVYYARCGDEEWIYWSLNGVGVAVVSLSLIVMIILGVNVSQERIIDEKIALYEEENTHIQQQVAEVVEQYMAFEQQTYDKIAPEDPTLVVTIFPELKSNELVTQQVELYRSNAAQIKQLKVDKLNIKVCRWWLYFG